MIQIGYFKEFKGMPTVLIAASEEDFDHVYDALLSEAPEPIDLVALLRRTVSAIHTANLTSFAMAPHGSETRLTLHGSEVQWSRPDSYRVRLKGLLDVLKESSTPAHQYLETGTREMQLVVSRGEYRALLE